MCNAVMKYVKVVLKETEITAKEKRNEEHCNSIFSDLYCISHISTYQTLHDSEQKETRTVN